MKFSVKKTGIPSKEVDKDGFVSTNSDRDMTAYKLEEHEKW